MNICRNKKSGKSANRGIVRSQKYSKQDTKNAIPPPHPHTQHPHPTPIISPLPLVSLRSTPRLHEENVSRLTKQTARQTSPALSYVCSVYYLCVKQGNSRAHCCFLGKQGSSCTRLSITRRGRHPSRRASQAVKALTEYMTVRIFKYFWRFLCEVQVAVKSQTTNAVTTLKGTQKIKLFFFE